MMMRVKIFLTQVLDIAHIYSMKIKIFSYTYGTGGEVEKAVNEWLRDNPKIKVVWMAQSDTGQENGLGLTISILYSNQ